MDTRSIHRCSSSLRVSHQQQNTVTAVVTYYHGTSLDGLTSIRRHGLCPASSCLMALAKYEKHQYPQCEMGAVYVTRDFVVAHDFAKQAAFDPESDEPPSEPIVLRIAKLPSKCKIEEDPEGRAWDSWKIKNCDCVKPTAYCLGPLRKKCNWVKV